jgi:hypothetical protein
MSYLALEACAVVGLVLSIILAFVVADLSERIASMRQTLDSLKSKADEEEHKRWRARRDAEDAAELEREFPGLAALGLLPTQPHGKMRLAEAERERTATEERERLAASEKQRLAAEELKRQRIRSSLSWRLGRWFRQRSR